MALLLRERLTRNILRGGPAFSSQVTTYTNRSFTSSSGILSNNLDSSPVSSPIFKFQVMLERARFRSEWSTPLILKLQNRLECPRFGFPGVFDRSPPPPKTLHWTYAPVDGEYQKIKSILFWAVLHIRLLEQRIGSAPHYAFLSGHLFDYLSNELTSTWLPEASIPSFSIKSEGKVLIDWSKSVNSSTELEKTIRLNCQIPDPILADLLIYLSDQETYLAKLDLYQIVHNPSSWQWQDTYSNRHK